MIHMHTCHVNMYTHICVHGRPWVRQGIPIDMLGSPIVVIRWAQEHASADNRGAPVVVFRVLAQPIAFNVARA